MYKNSDKKIRRCSLPVFVAENNNLIKPSRRCLSDSSQKTGKYCYSYMLIYIMNQETKMMNDGTVSETTYSKRKIQEFGLRLFTNSNNMPPMGPM